MEDAELNMLQPTICSCPLGVSYPWGIYVNESDNIPDPWAQVEMGEKYNSREYVV